MKNSALNAVCVALLSYAGSAAAGTYTYTPLVFPGTTNPILVAGDGAHQGGINSNNQVVGAFTGSDNYVHGFVWSAGALVQVDFGAGQFTQLDAINDNGLAVGDACTSCGVNGVNQGFYYNSKNGKYQGINSSPSPIFYLNALNSSGTSVGEATEVRAFGFVANTNGDATQIDVPKAKYSEATGIDDGGTIVGLYGTKGIHNMGFTDLNGVFTMFNPPKSSRIAGLTITPNGLIVGEFFKKHSPASSFTYASGAFKVLNYPGGNGTYAAGAMANGTVVGFWLDQGSAEHGYIYSSGKYHSIDYPGATSTQLIATNPQGTLLGEYSTSTVNGGFFIAQCPQNQQPCTK